MIPKTCTLAASAIVAVTTACTAIAKSLANQPVPAYGVSEELAEAMGCDLEDIKTRGEQYKRDSYDSGGPGYVIPRVGEHRM